MRFGWVGTVRTLLLLGAAAALAPGITALARQHPRHAHPGHANPAHESPTAAPGASGSTNAQAVKGEANAPGATTANPPGATTANAPGATSANPPASAAQEPIEFVPGPTPLKPRSERPAGNSSGASENHGQTAASIKPPEPATHADDSGAGATGAKSAVDAALAKLFLGEPVYGAGGEQIGKLAQLVPGPDGEVKAAVITWGGLFGYFESSRTVAWTDAGPAIESGRLVLRTLTRDGLRNSGAARPQASR